MTVRAVSGPHVAVEDKQAVGQNAKGIVEGLTCSGILRFLQNGSTMIIVAEPASSTLAMWSRSRMVSGFDVKNTDLPSMETAHVLPYTAVCSATYLYSRPVFRAVVQSAPFPMKNDVCEY